MQKAYGKKENIGRMGNEVNRIEFTVSCIVLTAY